MQHHHCIARDEAPGMTRFERPFDLLAQVKLGVPDGVAHLDIVFAYVTTKKFLEVFGFATLRDLPDIERLEDEGLLQRPQ